jgi:putative nucleotidyltransferase with HDIG domain
VLDVLLEFGEHDPDLLAAALLHDVGKLRHPLHLWERVFIVLARSIAPSWAATKANPDGPGWQGALAVSEFHAQWGAEMLIEAGASQRLVDLVRRHQDLPSDCNDVTDRLLARLQQADNQS